ncbi:hypothetical protein KAR29_01105 [Aminithiophilus ramosus]|uniref:FeoB-associated Cys-rich membrane protein n=2 Tax=Synergistales TaxID=649776 RepID=A0A9Q7AN83_9BACT|nr:hypothetical protein [Aminithiophilus ramosus]QTX32572.1 hypothetical protein KAR29_01105 [Aminithiophilus ramosus]QVL36452.1 hypothetical protein KIH16_01115 [Synergistota bacterium]
MPWLLFGAFIAFAAWQALKGVKKTLHGGGCSNCSGCGGNCSRVAFLSPAEKKGCSSSVAEHDTE